MCPPRMCAFTMRRGHDRIVTVDAQVRFHHPRRVKETPAMRGTAVLVSALGVAQIVSWGTLFYAIGVLGRAMERDLAVSSLFVFGSFTAGLLVSGVLAPLAGRLVDARG